MLIVISFDGVSDAEFEKMASDAATYPNIAAFASQAAFCGGVRTTFVSNTYPIHTGIVTGLHPAQHGIISNLLSDDGKNEVWAQEARLIKGTTVFEAARRKGLKVGAVLWPATCGAKIKWNLPELHLRPGQNRIVQQMLKGSPLFQIRAMRHFGHKLSGIEQPQLDDFTSAVAADLLRRKKPDLTLVHLLAYDGLRHKFGMSAGLEAARLSLDESLGRLMDAAPTNARFIVFSDHSHLDVQHNIDLRPIYSDALYEQCGGCAFFTRAVQDIENQPWFGRYLTQDEMNVSGYAARAAFGVAAKPGYSLSRGKYAANHGYPADYENYQVFFAASNLRHGMENLPHGDIRNVAALIARELDL